MNKVYVFSLFAILFLSSTIAQSNFAVAEKMLDKYAPDRLLVKFKPGTSKNTQDELYKQNGVTMTEEISQIDVKILKVPESALDRVQEALSKHSSVEYAEKDWIFEPALIPNDPEFSKQWHLNTINAASAWDTSTGSSSIPIAILDTGVDPTHPDLSSKLVSGYNFYNNNNNWSDTCGHGTKVAGSAAAISNNAAGVAGVTWDNPIIPIKITDSNCYGYYSAMTKGIIHAADNGARAANISFLIFNGAVLTDAAKYMYDKGGWVVAAGGNTGKFENYSDNPYIISVGATSSSDTVTSFSSYGPYIDFAAPGSAIYTTSNGGSYGYASGTSFSSPITAGLVSLLFSANPSLTPSQVYDILQTTSVDLGTSGYDHNYGWGRIDAAAAMSQINSPAPPPEPEPTPDPISISIISPSDGSTVNGRQTISVSVSGFSSPIVTIALDGNLLTVLTSSPYEYGWHTKGVSPGSHIITATAIDSTNSATDTVTVHIEEKGQSNKSNPNKGNKPNQNELEIQEFADATVVHLSSTTKICHVPPGNPTNAHTIEIGVAAIPAHQAHGDEIIGSECPENELDIQEFSTANVVPTSDTLTEAIDFMNSIRVSLSSDSKVGPAVSEIAQLHKLFAHEDKEIKKAFQMEFKKFIKDVKAILKVGQGAEQKAALNELEKSELKIKMQIEKDEQDEDTNNKINSAIQLHNTLEDLQEIRNKIAIAKLNYDDKELVMLQDIERELLKNTMIFEEKSNGKKLTIEEIKSIDEKAAKQVQESHSGNSGNGNSGNEKGNGKGSDKSNDKGNDNKSNNSNSNKGNNGKSNSKKK